MSDLTDRLRTFGGGVLRIEAADEIDRLTAELAGALQASRWESDMCGQALEDLKAAMAARDELRENGDRLLAVADSAVAHQRDMIEAATAPLWEEIDALRAERDMWKDTLAQRDRELANARAADIHSCHYNCTRAGCVNARLREEVAGLREGAERYRWIRDNATGSDLLALPWDTPDGRLDAAIDAARKATP